MGLRGIERPTVLRRRSPQGPGQRTCALEDKLVLTKYSRKGGGMILKTKRIEDDTEFPKTLL